MKPAIMSHMALLSPTMGVLSGKVGDVIYAHNQYGQYVRAFTAPVDPNTTRQQFWRAAFKNAALRWKSVLTAAQREGWYRYAANLPRRNRLGTRFFATGQNAYVATNAIKYSLSASYIDTAPTIFSVPGLSQVQVVRVSGLPLKWRITFDTSDQWVNESGAWLLVHNGLANPAGVNAYFGPYRLTGTIAGSSSSPPSSPYESTTFGYPTGPGTRMWFRVRCFLADGRISFPQVVEAPII